MTGSYWPISDQFAPPNPTFSARKRGPPASGKSWPQADGCSVDKLPFQSAKRVIVLPGGIRLSQDVPLNLSARRTREGRQKMHGTGIRMCSVAVFDPLLKFRRELCGAVNARTQYH